MSNWEIGLSVSDFLVNLIRKVIKNLNGAFLSPIGSGGVKMLQTKYVGLFLVFENQS